MLITLEKQRDGYHATLKTDEGEIRGTFVHSNKAAAIGEVIIRAADDDEPFKILLMGEPILVGDLGPF